MFCRSGVVHEAMVRVTVTLIIGLVLGLIVSGFSQVHAGSSHCSQAIEQGAYMPQVECSPFEELRPHGTCAVRGRCMTGICVSFLVNSYSSCWPVLRQVHFPLTHARPMEGCAFPPPFKPPRLSV